MIPTMNRSDHLIRLLHYYKDVEFRGCISIGDSSNEHHKERVQKEIEKLRHDLNIVYQKYPGLNVSECMQRLAQSATTPYVSWMADDDFLVPSGVQQCIDFLDRNPDYTAAHGVGAAILVEGDGAYGEIVRAQLYNQPVLEAGSGSQRLVEFLSHGSSPLLSVHRVEVWRAIYREIAPVPDKSFQGNWIPSCHSAIQGKIKGLDGFYMVLQHRASRYHRVSDYYDWFTSDGYLPSFQYLRGRLAEELARHDKIGVDEAREVVKKAFWTYLQHTLHNAWESRYGQKRLGLRARLRQAVLQTPGLYRTWHRVRSFMGWVVNSPFRLYYVPTPRIITNSCRSIVRSPKAIRPGPWRLQS